MRTIYMWWVLVFMGWTAVSAQTFTYLPENIQPDSAHAPFYHGVASGDPLADAVILWTRISPEVESPDTTLELQWIIARDEMLTDVVGSGFANTDSTLDFTVKVDVNGLQPDTYYWYAFEDVHGNRSATGRTRTLPVGALDELKLGVASCSNIYYGFFNAYRTLAANDEIRAVIHLGDFIYDNDGSNKPTRIPVPEPYGLNNTNSGIEWADRQFYYRYDIDLRAMLEAHPIIAVWDNHDIDKRNHEPAVQAWLRWLPVREDPGDPHLIYRRLSFGDLADLYMTDVRLFNDVDTLPGGEMSFLGNDQFEWLTGEMNRSEARWQLIGSQKNFATWSLGWVADLFNLNSPFFTTSNWDGRPESRDQLKQFLTDEAIDNVVFLTGDAHMGLLADIDPDPYGDAYDYNPNTGKGSLGVEFLPSGVTGRNLDDRGIPTGLANFVESLSMNVNPHQFYLNMVQNGYGIIEMNRDSLTAWICYSNILIETDEEWCHGPFVVYNGANHWKRLNQQYAVPTSIDAPEVNDFYVSAPFPNPAQEQISFTLKVLVPGTVRYEVASVDGSFIGQRLAGSMDLGAGTHRVDLPLNGLAAGTYLLTVQSEEGLGFRKFTIVR